MQNKATSVESVTPENPVTAELAHKAVTDNKDNFTSEEISFAEELFYDISDAYVRSNVQLSYTKKNIVIKVNKPNQMDRIQGGYIEKKLTKLGVTVKVMSSGNKVYHLPRLEKDNG